MKIPRTIIYIDEIPVLAFSGIGWYTKDVISVTFWHRLWQQKLYHSVEN